MRHLTGLSPHRRSRLEELWIEAKWRSYSRDPVAFFRECVYVEAPWHPRGRVLLDLFDYQLDDLETFRTEKNVVVLKARQLGLTTLAMAYAFWMLMFRPGANIILVSKDKDTSESALAKTVDFMWQFMPAWARTRRPVLDDNNAREHTYRFPDGMRSRIISRAPTKTAGSGEVATLVLWDEAALPDVKTPGIGYDIYKSLSSTTDTTGGTMIVFSTARGGHNRFAQLFKAAVAGTSSFAAIFHPWWVSRFINPNHAALESCPNKPCPVCVDETQRNAKMAEFLDRPWEFYSEYPASPEEAFRMSGRLRFRGLPPIDEFADLGWRGRMHRSPSGAIELVADPDGPLRLDADLVAAGGPPLWSRSALSLDPASGNGGDYTAMVGGFMTREGHPRIAAYWHANDIEPAEAARHADMLGRWLSGDNRVPALLVVEDQGGHGQTPIYVLTDELAYPNMYVHRYTGHRKYKREVRFGMPMTDTRRPLIIDALAGWLRFDVEDLPVLEGIFPLLRHELGAFVVGDNGVPRADVGMNDDLVMAAGIWVYALHEEVGAPGAVTPPPRDEAAPQTYSLKYLFEEAEAARTSDARADREFARRLAKGFRSRG